MTEPSLSSLISLSSVCEDAEEPREAPRDKRKHERADERGGRESERRYEAASTEKNVRSRTEAGGHAKHTPVPVLMTEPGLPLEADAGSDRRAPPPTHLLNADQEQATDGELFKAHQASTGNIGGGEDFKDDTPLCAQRDAAHKPSDEEERRIRKRLERAA